MPTATKPSSFDFETLQQSIDAQGEQVRALIENLSRVSERSHLAEVAQQVAKLGELLSRVEERLTRGEQILKTLEEYQFGMIAGDTEVLKQITDRRLAGRLRETIRAKLPAGATALVVSKGDESLFASDWLRCWHFPQDSDGDYSGFHPADSGSAIIQLEALRAKGADYLIFPCTSLWWLDHYKRFRDHLHHRYREFHCEDDVCVIYALREASRESETNVWVAFENALTEVERRIERDPAVLDWATGCELREKFPCRTVFSPPFLSSPTSEPRLPYLDQTIDIVAIASSDPSVIAEARRVAEIAVLIFEVESSNEPTFKIQWLANHLARPLPSVSIIIPSYNGISLTEDCIRALQETLPGEFQGEIIVVDDASTDDTPRRMAHLVEEDRRIKFVRNPQNLGFVGTCNHGAELAGSDILIFLNNDTLPQPGWLEPLLATFETHPEAGAVGGKLVYPDGRLQEAGGVIFNDGSAANFGRGDHQIDAPLYNYVREVDYVTGALIATPRQLFEKLGGLDLRYRPIYYEETDYCFQVREAGFKVYYQPLSVVIHLEGVTCGTDASAGQKRYQLLNQQKFAERWRDALCRQPENPHHFDAWTWYGLAVREERTPNASTVSNQGTARTQVTSNGDEKEGAMP